MTLSFTCITNLVNQVILLTDENCYFYTFSLYDQECCLHWELLSILMLDTNRNVHKILLSQ